MGKDCLNLKTDPKKISLLLSCAGMLLTIVLAIQAIYGMKLEEDFKIPKKEAGEGSYEEELVAVLGKEKVALTIEIEEKNLSEKEAQERLGEAASILDEVLKAENESLSRIESDVCFTELVPGTGVEVEWTDRLPDYFHSDGTLREDLELLEPIEEKITAILSIQNYTEDYEAVLTICPVTPSLEWTLSEQIEVMAEDASESDCVVLPKEHRGKTIVWKRSLDLTFLYTGFLTVAAVVFLKVGSRRDARIERKKQLEAVEKDYAQIVSKFTMLLSAGLSVRNAWERIVFLSNERSRIVHPVYAEMAWALRQMQQGVSELEVYERFGRRVGQVHYKKLMALFVLDKKRGGINLPEAMNQEMLQALEEQKRKTRQQGEKKGTRLLLPMMGMLAVVFIMILAPSFLSFQL